MPCGCSLGYLWFLLRLFDCIWGTFVSWNRAQGKENGSFLVFGSYRKLARIESSSRSKENKWEISSLRSPPKITFPPNFLHLLNYFLLSCYYSNDCFPIVNHMCVKIDMIFFPLHVSTKHWKTKWVGITISHVNGKCKERISYPSFSINQTKPWFCWIWKLGRKEGVEFDDMLFWVVKSQNWWPPFC